MEEMMKDGLIGGVLDFSIIEVSNEIYHALLAGGPERLTTAGRLGLPQVICPGAVEVLVFNEPETVPAAYRGRTLVRHSPQITDLRLNRSEMIEVAREVARRLREVAGPAVVMIPMQGFDAYDVPVSRFTTRRPTARSSTSFGPCCRARYRSSSIPRTLTTPCSPSKPPRP